LKFSKRISKSKRISEEIFKQGIWNPTVKAWSDVVEDYLYISRKRTNNKLAMFKLQLSILAELLQNSNAIEAHKEELKKLEQEKTDGKMSEEQYNKTYKGPAIFN
jgi:hypothetical protein